jgi:hypothetical protein
MASENKPVVLVDKEENDQINRSVMAWVNSYPDIPEGIAKDFINYEYLEADKSSMALSTIQGAYITRRYILGGYLAEYQFKLIYRIKPQNSFEKRLDADEVLDALGDWCTKHKPTLGDSIIVRKVEATTRSALFAAYDNGDEDHQILMKLTYEVI